MVGQRPRDILALLMIAWTTATEAIKREPQRQATGATAAPMPIRHSKAYPGGSASKKNMAVASPFF